MTMILLTLLMLMAPATPGEARPLPRPELSVLGGLGCDLETAEDSPFRCLAGMDLLLGALDLRLLADCGVPWEPSSSIRADLSVIDRRALRLSLDGQAWLRRYSQRALERGYDVGARVELGRAVAFLAAGGWAGLSTVFPAAGVTLADANPWARLGVVVRPSAPARFELAIVSDSSLSLWLRTSFELSASWRARSGLRVEGLVAARYSDFFTFTAYPDGLQAQALVLVPLGRGSR
jgi:hypothetical protein